MEQNNESFDTMEDKNELFDYSLIFQFYFI